MKRTYRNEPEDHQFLRGKNLKYYEHFHLQIEMIYCLSGEIDMMIDDEEYTLKAGDLGVVFPNLQHSYAQSGVKKDNEVCLLIFYPSYIEEVAREWMYMLPEYPIIRKDQLPDFFPQIWEQLSEVYANNKELYMFRAYASLIAAHILPLLRLNSIRDIVGDIDARYTIMQRVMNYIYQHFREEITLAKVAKEVGVSQGVLSKMFTTAIGDNFVNTVNSMRISYAKKLLESKEYSVGEICYMAGFRSNRTFFRNFKERCKMTPMEYRERCRK